MDPLKLTLVANTRHSITLAWRAMEDGVAYRLQLQDRQQGWVTKYWGLKTQVEVGGLGPEESYNFRVGVTRPGEDQPCVWSKVLPANTKDDLILVANLHRSVKYGNLNAVRKFITNRPYALDSYNQLGQPTIAMATNPQITALLLNSGTTVDQPARFTGRTALMQAAADGQVEVAAVLLERGASWATRDRCNYPPVQFEVHCCRFTGRTALMQAAADGQVEVAAVLLERGASWAARDRMGCTAVHYAVDTSQLAIVDLALESGANLNIKDSCGWTPLVRGVVLGSDVEVLRRLLAAGAEVDGPCLLLAVLSHRCNVARLLLDAGAAADDPGHLLTVAAAQGDNDIERLLRMHFRVESPKKDGKLTPTMITPSI